MTTCTRARAVGRFISSSVITFLVLLRRAKTVLSLSLRSISFENDGSINNALTALPIVTSGTRYSLVSGRIIPIIKPIHGLNVLILLTKLQWDQSYRSEVFCRTDRQNNLPLSLSIDGPRFARTLIKCVFMVGIAKRYGSSIKMFEELEEFIVSMIKIINTKKRLQFWLHGALRRKQPPNSLAEFKA